MEASTFRWPGTHTLGRSARSKRSNRQSKLDATVLVEAVEAFNGQLKSDVTPSPPTSPPREPKNYDVDSVLDEPVFPTKAKYLPRDHEKATEDTPVPTPQQTPRVEVVENTESAKELSKELAKELSKEPVKESINDRPAHLSPKKSNSPRMTSTRPRLAKEKLDESRMIREAKESADYDVRLAYLRKMFPHLDIPKLDHNTPLSVKIAMYNQYKRMVHIDTHVSRNKTYLLILWLLIEYIIVGIFKMDYKGYTADQIQHIDEYYPVLRQMAEKSYDADAEGGSGETGPWTPFMNAIWISITNATGFGLLCILAKYVGKENAGSLKDTIMKAIVGDDGSSNILHDIDNMTADNPEPAKPPPGESETTNLLSQFGPMLLNTFMGAQNKPQVKKSKKRF